MTTASLCCKVGAIVVKGVAFAGGSITGVDGLGEGVPSGVLLCVLEALANTV